MAVFKLGKQILLKDPGNALFSLLDNFCGPMLELVLVLSLPISLPANDGASPVAWGYSGSG